MVWLSKSSKSQTSKSILLISPLSAFRFLSHFTEMSRRMSFMNHINFSSFCFEICWEFSVQSWANFQFFCVKSWFFFSKIQFFQNFNTKTICPIFLRISQKALNMYISLLVKFDLILFSIFPTLTLSVGLCAELFCDQLCHHKFHVISLVTMFLCPKIASK